MEPHPFTTRVLSDVPLLMSDLIPDSFCHGFTTRAGGVSEPPYDSLNLGWKWGDDPGHVDENHRRLLVASGAASMVRVSQVHETRVLRVRRNDDSATLAGQTADGLCSDGRRLGLSVHVADCTPIVMACPHTGACAVLHAGWRGTVAGIARTGVLAMVSEFGCRPSDLRVALGPCIGPCCFEVGDDVADAFSATTPGASDDSVVVLEPGRKPHVDLRRYQGLQLVAAGILPEHIDTSSDCTFCDPDSRFYSFRKHGRTTGQLVGFVLRR